MLDDSRFRGPVTLRGPLVDLVPVAPEHGPPLARAVAGSDVFRYMRLASSYALSDGPEGMARMIDELLARAARGQDLPFTVVGASDGRPLGMTRFLDIDRTEESVEIGGTWFPPELWGSGVNVASKRLLLEFAFEHEGAHRVQIKTDLRNLRSQHAIEALGATREGVLREHVIMADGYRRSSVYFSILRSEWPAVRERLDARVAASRFR